LGKKKKKEREMRERNGGRSSLGGRLVGGGDIYDDQFFLPVVEKMSRGRPIFFPPSRRPLWSITVSFFF
jgi:hypothetical protein